MLLCWSCRRTPARSGAHTLSWARHGRRTGRPLRTQAPRVFAPARARHGRSLCTACLGDGLQHLGCRLHVATQHQSLVLHHAQQQGVGHDLGVGRGGACRPISAFSNVGTGDIVGGGAGVRGSRKLFASTRGSMRAAMPGAGLRPGGPHCGRAGWALPSDRLLGVPCKDACGQAFCGLAHIEVLVHEVDPGLGCQVSQQVHWPAHREGGGEAQAGDVRVERAGRQASHFVTGQMGGGARAAGQVASTSRHGAVPTVAGPC